jgi:hypothetical protein
MEGYFETHQRYVTTGTEEERRLLSSAYGMRLSDEAFRARRVHAAARGMAIDEAHHFDYPSMPEFLKAVDEPPYYALVTPAQVGEEVFAATAHTFLRIKAFPHPDKGTIEAIVPQRPTDPYGKLLIYEAFVPGTQRPRFRDYSCGPFSRLETTSAGTFDSDGVEERECGSWVERKYFDETGTNVIGRRVLNDGLVIADCRDIVAYAHEERTDGNEFPLRVWGRKNSDVTCCTHFNDEGARTHCVFSDGRTSHFTGAAGQERQISVTKNPSLHDGVVREFYAGPPGATYMTRQVCEDGTIRFFAGTTPNLVRLVKKWHPSGKTELYEGEHRRERKIGEGFEPRGGVKFATPSPALIKAVVDLNQASFDDAPNDILDQHIEATEMLARREGLTEGNIGKRAWDERTEQVRRAVDGYQARVSAHYDDFTLCSTTLLIVYTGIEVKEALNLIVAHQAAAKARGPSQELINAALVFGRAAGGTASEEEKSRLFYIGLRIAVRDGYRSVPPTEGQLDIDRSKYTKAQLDHAYGLSMLTSLTAEAAMAAIMARNKGVSSSSGGGLVGAVAGATKAVGKLLLGPPAPAASEPSGPKAGTQLRVGTDHPRSDLHGKRLALTKPVGGDVWEFKWLDAPEPKRAKGQTAWSIALAQTVTDETYLAAKAAKEAERAAKAESSKAKKRAQKQAKQLAADAQLAAELQAEEEKAAQPAPPGPPPEGKHHPLEALARCPIDGAPLSDAVLASDGWVYNKAALQSFWCAHEALVSPITGVEVTNVLRAHNPLRSLAKELQAAPVAKREAVPTEEPEFVLCPITHEVMATPVLAEDGYAYDQAALAQWFKTGATISPLTGSPMGETVRLDRHMAVLCRAWS